MSDKELWDALSVIARRMGLLERGQRLEVVGDPRDEPEGVPTAELCRRVGEHKGVRLLCNYARGHNGGPLGTVVHSWERALVGLSPCANNQGPSANAPLCELPTNHAGEHAASAADGTIWEWGDAPQLRDGHAWGCAVTRPHGYHNCAPRHVFVMASGGACSRCDGAANEDVHHGDHETVKVCRSRSPRADNGAYFTCVLLKGHDGEHRSITALGPKTWGDACGAKNAAENPVMAGQVCDLPRGHDGSHEVTVRGQRWLFGAANPPEVHDCAEPREVPCQCGLEHCNGRAGHADPTTERA